MRFRGLLSLVCGGLSALVVAGSANASTMTLTYQGAAPAGTVTLGGVLDATSVAGVMDWLDPSNNYVFTYCIDVQHHVPANSNTYTVEGLSTGNLNLDSAAQTAIANLFALHLPSNGPSNILTTPTFSALEGAEFQIALWDLIYNYSNGVHLGSDALTIAPYLGTPDAGQIAAVIDPTTGWAAQAYAAPASTGANLDVEALYLDGAQDQGVFLGVVNQVNPVPLQSSLVGGIGLLALLAGVRARRVLFA
jgi:hypothetical protein